MSALSIQVPFPVFQDRDGQPLDNGYVWIGTANLDPQVNPINVYWDAALTIAAVQPIRTIGGYSANSGTPARVYVDSDYSIRVMNKNGSTIYTSLNGNLDSGSIATNATGNGVQTVFPVAFAPNQIFISGVYQNQNTYSFNAGDVIFSEAPPLNSIIEFTF